MKKILVTGGAGFIGSNFIIYMLEKYLDYKIINYDLLTYAGNLTNLSKIKDHQNYFFVKGNINNRELLEYTMEKFEIDTIINFAAESHVDRSITNPSIFFETNVLGTLSLLDVAKERNVDKFIQISTDEVYGSLGNSGYFTEDTPLDPNSPYSSSKASADLLVMAYMKTYQLNVNITRCSNNYGPYQFPEKLIPLMISNAIDGLQLPIYGNGKNIRDWLHVYDHCKAIDLVLHKGNIGEIYNIGGHNEKTNNEIVDIIINKLQVSSNLKTFVEDRLGHDKRYAIDPTKIETELGWKPKYTFDTGILETLSWYQNNEIWWRQLKNRR